MKNLFAFVWALLLCGSVAAQTITVNGGCIEGPVTLTQGTSPALIDGKPYYQGTGTVAGNPGIPISIQWESSENLWHFILEGGYVLFTSNADTPLPPGTASPIYSWETGEAAPCASPAPLSVTGNVVLWVIFGGIDAFVKDNALQVNWTTEKEVNNDHFEIEASTDGLTFTTIGKVKSKAEDGNSDISLHYEWSGTANMAMAALPYLVFALMLLFFARRRSVKVFATAVACFIGVFMAGCKKEKDSIAGAGDYYIRIAQIDKDGTKTYSKVVRVKGE